MGRQDNKGTETYEKRQKGTGHHQKVDIRKLRTLMPEEQYNIIYIL